MQVQLIYDLESDSAGLGKAYYAIRDMKELVACALDNVATADSAAEIQVSPSSFAVLIATCTTVAVLCAQCSALFCA